MANFHFCGRVEASSASLGKMKDDEVVQLSLQVELEVAMAKQPSVQLRRQFDLQEAEVQEVKAPKD